MKTLKILSLICLSLGLVNCAKKIPPMYQVPPQKTMNIPQEAMGKPQDVLKQERLKPGTLKQGTLKPNLSTNVSPGKMPSSWELNGAMAARSKNKNWTASINWLQSGPNSYQIRLIGPLGNGSALIEKHGSVVSYKEGSKVSTSSNAESLLSQKTGVRIPVPSLYYWVRGLPAPGKITAQKRAPQGQLLLLQQGGFSVEYLKYTQVGGTYLPSLIRLQGGGVFVKLAIKNWRI